MEEFDDFGGFNPGGSPLNQRQQRKVEEDLASLSGDPMRHEVRDLDYDNFVSRQFGTAYAGNSPVPRAKVETVYVPKPKTDFFGLARPVGPGQANTIYDVARAKNALSSLGFARFDLTKERSTEPTPNFFNRIRRAQNALGESIDGIMNPGGATISALRDSRAGKRPTGFELGVLKTAAMGRNAALAEPGAGEGSVSNVPPGVLDKFQRRGLDSIVGPRKPPEPKFQRSGIDDVAGRKVNLPPFQRSGLEGIGKEPGETDPQEVRRRLEQQVKKLDQETKRRADSVKTMLGVMGIDSKLIGKKPEKILDVVRAVMNTRRIVAKGGLPALLNLYKKIGKISEKGHPFLVEALLTKVVRARRKPETAPWALSDKELLSVYHAVGGFAEGLEEATGISRGSKKSRGTPPKAGLPKKAASASKAGARLVTPLYAAALLAAWSQRGLQRAYGRELRRRGLIFDP